MLHTDAVLLELRGESLALELWIILLLPQLEVLTRHTIMLGFPLLNQIASSYVCSVVCAMVLLVYQNSMVQNVEQETVQ